MMQFITGSYAWAFLPVLILGVLAFCAARGSQDRHLPAIQLTAAVMYVVAIFFKRYVLMAMGFARDPLGQLTGIYIPSPVEVFLALGILAFGLLFVTLAVKVLPMEITADEHHETAADYDASFEAAQAAAMSNAEVSSLVTRTRPTTEPGASKRAAAHAQLIILGVLVVVLSRRWSWRSSSPRGPRSSRATTGSPGATTRSRRPSTATCRATTAIRSSQGPIVYRAGLVGGLLHQPLHAEPRSRRFVTFAPPPREACRGLPRGSLVHGREADHQGPASRRT